MFCSIDKAFNENNEGDKNNYSIFTAQGNLNNELNGTSLSEVRRKVYEDNDCGTLDDNYFNFSDMDDESIIIDSGKKNQRARTHSYYINKFLSTLSSSDDNSLSTLCSMENEQIYKHIGKCKYCRSQINKKLKKSKKKKIYRENNTNENKKSIAGYSYKDIMVILLVCIILIFIFMLIMLVKK